MTQRLEDLKAALADRYEIEREIGQGGMATVYLARDQGGRMKRIPRRTPGGSRGVVTLLIVFVTAIMPAPLIAQQGHGGAHRGSHARAVSHRSAGHVVRGGHARAVSHRSAGHVVRGGRARAMIHRSGGRVVRGDRARAVSHRSARHVVRGGRARAVRHVSVGGHVIGGGRIQGLALGHRRGAVAHHEGLFVHHGLHVGLLIAAPFYAVGYPYYVRYRPYRARYRVAATVTEGRADFELHIEDVDEGIVRLSWPGDRRGIIEVGLFLADSEQQVLAVQTVRAAPFTAVFDIVASMAYAGMTVVYDDGRTVTILVPYAP